MSFGLPYKYVNDKEILSHIGKPAELTVVDVRDADFLVRLINHCILTTDSINRAATSKALRMYHPMTFWIAYTNSSSRMSRCLESYSIAHYRKLEDQKRRESTPSRGRTCYQMPKSRR